MTGLQPERGGHGRQVASWLTGLLVLGLLVLLILRQGDPRELLHLLEGARLPWLVVAALLQAGTYVCAAGIWQRVLLRAGQRVQMRSLLGLALAKLFTDQAMPTGGVGGSVVVVRGLVRRGVSRGLATAAILMSLQAFYTAFAILLAAGLLFLWAHHDLSGVVLTMAGLFLVLALLIPWGIRWLNFRGAERTPAWLRRLPGLRNLLEAIFEAPSSLIRDKRLLFEVVGLYAALIFLDASTLAVMLAAVGAPGHISGAWAAYLIALLAATVGIVPGGLGTFEGTSVAMLHMLGWDIEAALAATLLTRAFTFWLPMLPGLLAARLELRGRRASQL